MRVRVHGRGWGDALLVHLVIMTTSRVEIPVMNLAEFVDGLKTALGSRSDPLNPNWDGVVWAGRIVTSETQF